MKITLYVVPQISKSLIISLLEIKDICRLKLTRLIGNTEYETIFIETKLIEVSLFNGMYTLTVNSIPIRIQHNNLVGFLFP